MPATVTDRMILSNVERFFRRADIRRNLDFLVQRLPYGADLYVVGGAIRNLIIDVLHGDAPPTRDIDIFIGGLAHGFPLPGLLANQRFEITDFKGVRWYPARSNVTFDLGLLNDFVVIDSCHLEPTMENLLAGIDFTVNAILYDVRAQTLVENGCTASIAERVIDFNSRLIPDKRLIAYRILLIRHKTGFNLSDAVFRFVKCRLELETITRLKRLFKAKLGKPMAKKIMDDYNAMCKYPSYGAYLADRL
jgi:hypothetical protein